MRAFLASLALGALALAAPSPADALSACRPVAQHHVPIIRASTAPLTAREVRLTFVGHATFVIESARGVRVETDYNDFVRSAVAPTVATMNRAHSTHYSMNPHPDIRHVLRGWVTRPDEAEHDLDVEDVRIRNVFTNIRGWGGDTQMAANSIFLVEVAGVCFAHLGHLHHTLTPEHLRDIGRVDVLLVPVDGSFTLDIDGLKEVLEALQASVMVPMHFFNIRTLERFLARARTSFAVSMHDQPQITFTRESLPRQPTVIVMPGEHPRYDIRGRLEVR